MSAVEKKPWLQGGAGVKRMVNIPLVHLHPSPSCEGGSPLGCRTLLSCSIPAHSKPFPREEEVWNAGVVAVWEAFPSIPGRWELAELSLLGWNE